MTNTKNCPIEALERAFPMRVLRQRLRHGSGGAGWSAGGEGIERDLQVLDEFNEMLRDAESATSDDVTITSDGRRLDTKEKVPAFCAEPAAERAHDAP